jgi:hypothetical protein
VVLFEPRQRVDTNTRSWCDGNMTNTCSVLDAPVEATSLAVATRPASRRRQPDHRVRGGWQDLAFPPRFASHSDSFAVTTVALAVEADTWRPACSGAHEACASPRRARGSNRAAAARKRRNILLLLVAAGILVALALPWGGAGGRPLATPGPARAGDAPVAHELYIVQPGDTLWSIAQRLVPGGDPRPIEQELEAQTRGDVVVPGQRLVLP